MRPKELIHLSDEQLKIYMIRCHKVMLNRDLAGLYGVETKVLKQAVKRNLERFPEDFMFELTDEELNDWRSQIVVSNPGYKKGLRYKPFAFTEQGVAMLSSVLKSSRAIQINIYIMRAFIRLRELQSSYKSVTQRLDAIEKKMMVHDDNMRVIFMSLRQLTQRLPHNEQEAQKDY